MSIDKNKTFVPKSLGTGVVTFDFDFFVTGATDVGAFRLSTVGAITPLSNPTHFTVNSSNWKVGGTVTLVTDYDDGTLYIYRASDFYQEETIINNTKTPEETYEYMVDKVTMITQELQERVLSAIRGPVGETKDLELPHYLERVGYIHFNSITREMELKNFIELDDEVSPSPLGISLIEATTSQAMRDLLLTHAFMWDVGVTYDLYDVVAYNGRVYKSLQNSNTGNIPPSHAATSWWQDIAFYDLYVSHNAIVTNNISMGKDLIVSGADHLKITDLLQDVDAYSEPPTGAEIFPLDTPDCISSLGRRPLSYFGINYEPAKATVQGVEVIDSLFNKFSGHGAVGVFEPTSNYIFQPEDLSNTTSWAYSSMATATLSTQVVKGLRLWELALNSTTNGYAGCNITNIANEGSGYIILKNKNLTDGVTQVANINYGTNGVTNMINVTWATQTVAVGTAVTATSHWLDDDTVEIYWEFHGVVDSATWLYIYTNTDAGRASGDAVYASAVMVSPLGFTISPYCRLGRPAGILDYPKKLSTGKFSFGFWFRPCFTYDTDDYCYVAGFRPGAAGTYNFGITYEYTLDKFSCEFYGGTNFRNLYSQQFDDGTTYDTLNQWLYIAGAVDLNDVETPWFKVYGDNGTSETADETWSGALDTYADFPELLTIGKSGDGGMYAGNGFYNDFMIIDDSMWTEAEADTHFTANTPWKVTNRLLGENSNFMMNGFGDAFFRKVVSG